MRELRRENNMTVASLAQASGLSRGHVSNMEYGLVVMTVGTISAVARALGLPPFMLLMFPDEDPFAAAVEHVRLQEGGNLVRTARVLRGLIFGRGGPQRPPGSEGGGSP